ncbi:MAG: hypothetical protein PUD57_01930 [Clostridiales bacterium]|nr:hypothetical protein [Clostridiales bacterium]
MQDEKERGTELDYCDLDPTKICDNCCKCIDSGKDYEDFQIELTDSISTLDEIMELPFDDDLFDDDDEYSFDPHNVEPLDIDPKLMAEWEQKLRAAEIEDAQQKIRGLKGVRKKR